VIIDAKGTSYIAMDVLEMIQDFANIRALEEDIKVQLVGFRTSYKDYETNQTSHVSIDHRRSM
jgi:hypothetical protein